MGKAATRGEVPAMRTHLTSCKDKDCRLQARERIEGKRASGVRLSWSYLSKKKGKDQVGRLLYQLSTGREQDIDQSDTGEGKRERTPCESCRNTQRHSQ